MFTVEYRKGIKHTNADALSRLTNENDEDEITNIANEKKTYIICLSSTLIISIYSESDDQIQKRPNFSYLNSIEQRNSYS